MKNMDMTLPRSIARGLASAALLALGACAPRADLPVVTGIDAERYLGRWHEIASIPQWFQRACVADTTAEYGKAPDGTIAVTNGCRKADGTRSVATGSARFVAAPGEGKLEVTFLRLFGDPLWLISGDYWVVALDPDYRWSVVGHPGRDYGWILSRDPTMPRETLLALRQRLVSVGYDTCLFQVTSDPARPRLCDL